VSPELRGMLSVRICGTPDGPSRYTTLSAAECYTPCMDLPPKVQARRAVEDKAIKLGNERTRLESRLAGIIEDAVGLMSDAEHNGVSIERLAELIQISRPTLYRWRDGVAILRADRAEHGKEGEE
jgi:hypothetical protein